MDSSHLKIFCKQAGYRKKIESQKRSKLWIFWLSLLSFKKVESNSIGFLNRCAEENLVVNNKGNKVFMSAEEAVRLSG